MPPTSNVEVNNRKPLMSIRGLFHLWHIYCCIDNTWKFLTVLYMFKKHAFCYIDRSIKRFELYFSNSVINSKKDDSTLFITSPRMKSWYDDFPVLEAERADKISVACIWPSVFSSCLYSSDCSIKTIYCKLNEAA